MYIKVDGQNIQILFVITVIFKDLIVKLLKLSPQANANTVYYYLPTLLCLALFGTKHDERKVPKSEFISLKFRLCALG